MPTKWEASTRLVEGKIVGGETLEYPRQYQVSPDAKRSARPAKRLPPPPP